MKSGSYSEEQQKTQSPCARRYPFLRGRTEDCGEECGMETKGNKPSLGWAILSLVLPVAMILYGTLFVGVRTHVLTLI